MTPTYSNNNHSRDFAINNCKCPDYSLNLNSSRIKRYLNIKILKGR